ncbi:MULTISPECIES: hypothetical protein [unclassified Paenibacillus]|uniref:hypothetical protein n=1 Tax=unclassified Paenibacillus TaxID=185978 RepID=UPI000F97D0DF|nr:hypothetical protein [Paenibacillus sp. CH40]MCP3795520.1 hypothetical protein [Paenibacillus sp. CH40]
MRKLNAKTWMIIGLIIVLLFGVWNAVWFILTNNRYDDFLKAVPKSKFGNHIIKKDGYVYNVKRPDYLSFTGNLGINNPEARETLIIWPLIDGSYEFGVRLQKDGIIYELSLDEQMQPVDQNDKQTNILIQELKPEITALYEKANSMWKLD